MYLINPNKKQYKANLHCHSTCSDGKCTPEQLKEMYKSHGYSVLAITDHENPKKHTDLTDSEFIAITGYEAYIRPSAECVYDIYTPEVHLNLLARDPDNESIVCYNPAYIKYALADVTARCKRVGSEKTREYTTEYVNEFIKTAVENGYIVTYNHPVWSMEDEATSLAYEGFFSMEMCNYSSYVVNGLEYNAVLYDKMLSKGKRVFCHGSDDNHNVAPDDSPNCDSYGAFTMIMADGLSYDSVFSALEKGEMYASMGPAFSEISVEGNKVHVECSPVERIMLYMGSKSPKRVVANAGETITSADFEIDPRAKFIRISAVDSRGRFADTRGYFLDEIR